MKNKTIQYPRPHILDQLSLADHAVIEASAGTGKTYTMEHLVVDILLSTDTRLEEILTVTYTERATADLKKRIRAILETVIAAFENPTQTTSEPTDPDQTFWIIDHEANKKLKRALFSFDVAPIHTIHGFCQRVLTENAFDNHRLFDEEHVDQDRLFDTVFAEALRRDFSVDPKLAPYINAWMQGRDNALAGLRDLLNACTRTRGTIAPQFNPEFLTPAIQTLADLFTQHDETTLDALIRAPLTAQKVHGTTRNTLLKRVESLRDPILDYANNHQSIPHLLSALEPLKLEYFDIHADKFALAGQPAHIILDAIQHVVPFEVALANLFTDVMKRRLREAKDTLGVFSFDDMLTHVWESLNRPGSTLTEVLRRRYKYALIDEFQDTDEVQWQIFRRIFHQSDKKNILYVIGDPKQAIYAFRGADIFTYLRARQEIINANGRLVRLDHNFRSTPDVIAGYNYIFDQTADQPFFTGTINYEYPVQCGKPDLILAETNGPNTPPIHIFQIVPPVGEPLSSGAIRHTVAREYALEIRRLLKSNLQMNHPDEPSRTIQPRDIYVLTHRHHEGHLIGDYLRRLGVPCAFYKQDGLFQTAEARDIAQLLDAIANINDRAKRKFAWMTPFFNIPLTTLPALDELPETHPLIEHIRSWNQLAKSRRFEELFARVTESSGLLRREIFFKDSERELTNYIHIFEILLEEATDQHLDLDELVLRLESFINETAAPAGENGNVQRLESERNAVQIMTLHKSKGLEADIVFVFGGFSERFRSSQLEFHDDAENTIFYVGKLPDDAMNRYQTERDQEAQRLFYVALTRARGRLYLPFVGKTNGLTDKTNANSDYPRLNGIYLGLNNRLNDIVTNPTPSFHQHFLLREIYANTHLTTATNPNTDRTLTTWQPPADLLSNIQPINTPFQQLVERLRTGRLKVSSYSHMKNLAGGYQNHLATNEFLTNLSTAEFSTDSHTPDALTALGPDALPGGAEAGKFLHAIIENLDFQTIQQIPDLATFATDPSIHHIFTTQLNQYGLNPQHLPYAKQIIFHTLTTPITTPDTNIPNIATCTPTIVELEFIFPIPETTHPQLTHALQTLPTDGFEVRRGYIKGFIDLVFHHDNRIYFADWKSDILDSYAPQALQNHVQKQYAIQAQLYTLAMVKMLGITTPEDYQNRFGGFFYLFLRGITPQNHQHLSNPGIFYQRLTWPEILAYQQDLTQLAL